MMIETERASIDYAFTSLGWSRVIHVDDSRLSFSPHKPVADDSHELPLYG